MIVNVASRCGFTPQYEGSRRSTRSTRTKASSSSASPPTTSQPGVRHQRRDPHLLHQEVQRHLPDDVQDLGGRRRPDPALQVPHRKALDPQFAGEIKWNFTKFLVDRNGNPVARFEPAVTPDSPQVIAAIEAALKQ